MKKLIALAATAVVLNSASAAAQDVERFRDKGYSVTAVTPVFSQLVRMSYPKDFALAFQDTKADFYIQEHVPKGESVGNWTQMVTLTGKKDLASKPGATALAVLRGMAAGFHRACAPSYAVKTLSDPMVDGYEAAIAVVSCGVSPSTAGKTSETAMIVVIKGGADFYTVQWAERGTRSDQPIPVDVAKWQGRFKALNPIKLCPIIPGEKAPYPSCVGGQKSPA